jgi:alpha-ribazole phosphatase
MNGVWLARHAPVAVSGLCYGQSDVPVTLAPDQAAARIAERWEGSGHALIPELWSSPWARTSEVAHVLARRWSTKLRVDGRLSELAFGEWENRAFSEIEERWPEAFFRWMQSYDVFAPPGGETTGQLRDRVADWLGAMQAGARTVLAITHAGPIRMARAIASGREYRDVAHEKVDPLLPESIG